MYQHPSIFYLQHYRTTAKSLTQRLTGFWGKKFPIMSEGLVWLAILVSGAMVFKDHSHFVLVSADGEGKAAFNAWVQ